MSAADLGNSQHREDIPPLVYSSSSSDTVTLPPK